MIKGSIQQGDTTIIDASKTGEPKYTKLILTNMKGDTDSNMIIIEDFTTHLPMDRTSRQKFNKETLALNDPLDQMNLVDPARTFHPKTRVILIHLNQGSPKQPPGSMICQENSQDSA